MDLLDVPFDGPMLLDAPFDVDQLFGDEFIQLLASDLATDDQQMAPFPLMLSENTHSPSSSQSACTDPLQAASPASQPQSSCGESDRPILLRKAAVARPKASGSASSGSLPALVWRTVTTAQDSSGPCLATPQQQEPSLPSTSPAAAAAIAPALALPTFQPLAIPAWHPPPTELSKKPSTDGSALSGPPSRKRTAAQQSKQVFDDSGSDSEDSNDTDDETGMHDAPTKCGSKRKAPEVDWRAIADPAERRRQRRLAKNRVTAARSRERKKSQWAVMEDKLNAMEAENRALREMLDAAKEDGQTLRQQLEAALNGSAAGATMPPSTTAPASLRGVTHSESAALISLLAIMLWCVTLPSEQAAVVLGSSALASLLLGVLLTTSRSSKSSRSARAASELKSQSDSMVEQQRAAKKARTRGGSARGGSGGIKSVAAPEAGRGQSASGIGKAGGLSAHVWTETLCSVGKAGRMAVGGLPRLGFVPAGLFVS